MNARNLLALIVGAVLVAACVSSGRGFGETRKSGEHVDFTWQSTGDHRGTMSATLASGQTLTGPWFQITHDTRIEQLQPLWYGWRPAWRGWPYWGPEPMPAFVTHYTGRVVANLEGEGPLRMRCRFTLVNPASQMAGGGTGKCQLGDGQTIDARFPAS
ncbi:MAG: hypothetical protein AB7G76_13530 [Steroidobacteraceae bacterium]